MREVVEEAADLMRKNEPCVVATVVRTKGSTPQKAGAKLLVRSDGTGVGTLGGGCVEGDIWFAAKEILRKKSGPEFRDYYLNEDIAARDGLVCGGTMYFLIEPILDAKTDLPLMDKILKAYDGGSPVAIATVVNTHRKDTNVASKILIQDNGTTQGSLGNATFDTLALDAGKRVAVYGSTEHIITPDGTEIFVEGFTTQPTLILLGGGHVNKALYNLATTLSFRTYIIDDRREFSNKKRFPESTETIVADFDKGLDKMYINANTFILVATRGHRYDDMALESAMNTPARYIGLLGSKRKSIMIYKRLIKDGHTTDKLEEIRAPVGLNIGAITPEELAVSIMAEIIMIRRGGDGSPLKMDSKQLKNVANQQEKQWEALQPSS